MRHPFPQSCFLIGKSPAKITQLWHWRPMYIIFFDVFFYGITRYMLFRGRCLSVNLAAFSHFLFINFNLVPSSKPQSFNCNVYFWLELYNWILLDNSYIVDKRGIFKFMVKKLTSFLRLTFPQQTSVYQRVHCMVFCKCHLKWTNYIFTVKLLKLGKENQSFKEGNKKDFISIENVFTSI